MQLLAKNIKTRSENDTKKEVVYDLDFYLSKIIKKGFCKLNKLYGELPTDVSIVELTKKIYKDFNVNEISEVKIKENINYSYYRLKTIVYSDYELKNNNIEVVLHEFAHYIVAEMFNVKESSHSDFFSTILKWIFNYYNVLDEDYFYRRNELVAENKIKYLDEAIVKLTPVDSFEIEEILNKNVFKSIRENDRFKKLIYIDKEKKEEHVLLINEVNGKGVYSIRKLFGYEIKKIEIKESNKEDWKGYVIFSPIHIIDDCGEQVTARDHWAGQEGFVFHEVVEQEDGRLYLNKKIYRNYDKEEVKREIKKIVYRLKKEKKKYKRCSTISKYFELKLDIEKKIYFG